MRHQLHTQIDINESPETVWKTLIDLDNYSDWNPFIVSAAGQPNVGERLTNRLQPPGGKAMTFRPTVTEVEPNRVLEWIGRLGFPGIFDGRHRFELQPSAEGTHLVHSEQLSGLLVRPLRKKLDTQTLDGFNQMNLALKNRVESHQGALT